MKKYILMILLIPTMTLAYSPFQGVDIQDSACNPDVPTDYSAMNCKIYMQMGGSGLIPTPVQTPPTQMVTTPDISTTTSDTLIATTTQPIVQTATTTPTVLSAQDIKIQEMQLLVNLYQQLIVLLTQLHGATQ